MNRNLKRDRPAQSGRWYVLPKRGLRVICCDCGGEHVAEFRYRKDGLAEYRAFRKYK